MIITESVFEGLLIGNESFVCITGKALIPKTFLTKYFCKVPSKKKSLIAFSSAQIYFYLSIYNL